jgi:hypothetical protein
MASRTNGLPKRFPVGTKFVIEGRPCGDGQVKVSSRYLEFPDGTCIRLPVDTAPHQAARAPRRGSRTRARRRRTPGH